MPDTVVNLLIQLPIVGIFVWFILEWSKRQDASAEKRDEHWQAFLREERQHRGESLARLAEEIKATAQEVARLNGILTAHDAYSRAKRGTGPLPDKSDK